VTPARGLVWLRPVETPETLGHGRIILTEKTREALTTHQMEVVSVGAPSICEEEDCERDHGFTEHPKNHICDFCAGQWVLVKHRGLSETHQEGLYCAHQDDILAVLQVVTR